MPRDFHIRFVLLSGAFALLLTGGSAPRAQGPSEPLLITHGIASGDVTAFSAVIWARSNVSAQVHVETDTDSMFPHPKSHGSAHASESTDFTAHVTVEGLDPDTRYWYRVFLMANGGQVSESLVGTFRTAPAPWHSRPVSFIVGADVGGQRFCRNAADGGYAIFAAMQALAPDFFIGNGDLVYVDGDCPADGPDGPGGWQNIPGDFPNVADASVDWTNAGEVWEIFLRHWRYNRADPFFQSFLRSTSMISQWDDHEVINDFGARWTYWTAATINRPGYPNLVAAGRDSFFAYSPIERNAGDPERIYRAFRWGKDVEVFVLDARTYRDRNDLPDTPENNKVMLGDEQLAWLVEGIQNSTATWKVVSSDVPISIGTGPVIGGPRDAWANVGAEPSGFERELLGLLADLDRINATNVVFVTTDVHFAQTIAYDTDADGDGDRLRFHELVSGPLNAVRNQPRELDPAANPTSLYAEGGLFNFNYVRISEHADGKIHLVADVRGPDGAPRPGSLLDLTPESGSQDTSDVNELVASHSQKCLDVTGWSTQDATPMIQWQCHGGDNQAWSIEPLAEGYSRVVSRHSDMCLDVSGASTEDGATIIQWPCHGGANQQWRLEAVGEGYRFVARHSGKCLDVTGWSTDDGAGIIQWQCHGGANQTWLVRSR